ncbi:MAG: hypothetical protein ACRD96_27430 [Bryobacteraceae bacterium]
MTALAALVLVFDLSAANSEPNLEKRSRLALVQAGKSLEAAREAYRAGGTQIVSSGLGEVVQAVELADTSLKQTGKNPSRSPKHFKHAEKEIRALVKKLDAFAHEMDAADRAAIDPARERLLRIHDRILLGILGKKK